MTVGPPAAPRHQDLATWLCNAATGCAQPAAVQWAYPITDEATAAQVATISDEWAGVMAGDTVPVFACETHQPADV